MKFDSETAKEAGKKSKRGKDKLPHELKMLLVEGSYDRVAKVWEALDQLKGSTYLNYIIQIMKLVVPKDLNLGGEVSVTESDARIRLIEKLAAKVGQTDNREDNK